MKPDQMPMFPDMTQEKKTEDVNLQWEGYIDRQTYGDENETIIVKYENGECFVDGKNVSFREFLSEIGPRKEWIKKTNDTFKKIVEFEEAKKK